MTTGSRMKSLSLEQKSRQIEPTQEGNEEVLERSYEETRRSSVQIRATPPKILNILIQMESDALGKVTIENTRKRLSFLSKNTDLDNPEQVKQFIASRNCTNGNKRTLAIAYQKYVKYYHLTWTFPKYYPEAKHIQIPSREKIEMLIANTKNPLSMKIRISMETGIRPVELCNLHTKDINLETRKLYPTTAKHGSPRILTLSHELTETISEYIHTNNLQQNDKLFNGKPSDYTNAFRRMKHRLAKKLHDPTIETIRLYDLRHYFATMLYAKTNKLLYVMQQMGHKHIETTMIYTQLLDMNDPEYLCETATNIEEAKKLLALGYDYIQEKDGISIYRKRK